MAPIKLKKPHPGKGSQIILAGQDLGITQMQWYKLANTWSNSYFNVPTYSSGSTTVTCDWGTGSDWTSVPVPAYTTFEVPVEEVERALFHHITRRGRIELPKEDLRVELPDGHAIVLKKDGSFKVVDDQAKVTYAANNFREFNPCVNAGDLLARFLEYAKEVEPRLTREDVAHLPLQLFVHWLIIEAAERDGDPIPQDVTHVKESKLLKGKVFPRCLLPSCRRFIKRSLAQAGFNYCNELHAGRHLQLLGGTYATG